MKYQIVAAVLAVGLSLPAPAADFRKNKLWKWSVAALAAANTADVITSAGHYELNPLLGRGRFGARAVGLKIAISGSVMAVQSLVLRRRPQAVRKAAYFNFAMAGLTGTIAARNTTQ